MGSRQNNEHSEVVFYIRTQIFRNAIAAGDAIQRRISSSSAIARNAGRNSRMKMKKIASLGKIEEHSVIRYVVYGLNMRSDFRYSLYRCKSSKEL